MLKYVLICALAVALSFLAAGLASHASYGTFLRRLGVGTDRAYRFYLGSSLFITLAVGGSLAAASGFGWLSALAFGFAVAGGLIAVSCVGSIRVAVKRFLKKRRTLGGGTCGEPDGSHILDGGGNCEEPVGGSGLPDGESHTVAVSCCGREEENDQNANDGDSTVCGVNETVIAVKRATDGCKTGAVAKIVGCIVRKSRTKAIIWCVVFAVSLVVFGAFFVASSIYSLSVDDAEILEKSTVLQRAERMGDTLALTAADGAETFLIFGYGAILDDADELAERICDGTEIKIRYAVMDEDKWSGEYMLLDARRGDEIYLRAENVLAARERARVEKLMLLGACSVACGAVCALYTAVFLKKRADGKARRISE